MPAVLHEMGLLSAKPVIYACNMSEDDLMDGFASNQYYPLVQQRAKEEGALALPICAKAEEDIAGYSASVIGWKDLEAADFDYAAVKAKGQQRTEGKEYVVQDGDVIEFLFNV